MSNTCSTMYLAISFFHISLTFIWPTWTHFMVLVTSSHSVKHRCIHIIPLNRGWSRYVCSKRSSGLLQRIHIVICVVCLHHWVDIGCHQVTESLFVWLKLKLAEICSWNITADIESHCHIFGRLKDTRYYLSTFLLE